MAVAQVVPGPQTAAIAPGGKLGRLASAAWSRLAAWLPDDARAAREAEQARRAGGELLARLQEEALCRADNARDAGSERAVRPAPLPVADPRAAPPSLAATRICFEPAGGSAAR